MNNVKNPENDDLLKYILNTRYFNMFRQSPGSDYKKVGQLELYLTSFCNLKCTYCYLNKYGHELYPVNATNFDEILNNIRMLLQYFLEEGFSFDNIDLFSGEVWGDKLGVGVLNLLLEFIGNGLIIKSIMIPTNFTFLLHDDKTQIMEDFIQKFSDVGSHLQLSVSIDGKYLEDQTRPFKDITSTGEVKYRDDNFYDKLFKFCRKHNFLFHPMVAAYGIEKWIDNYKWYKDNMIKYEFPEGTDSIMMLEVRNGDWTPEKIEEYIKFIDFLIDDKIKDVGGIENFTKYLNNIGGGPSSGYLPYTIPLSENTMPCTVQYQLTIRCGDLAIVGCHRMAYDDFVFGKFKVQDGRIVDIESHNVEIAAKILLSNPMNSIHGCDNCIYKKMCMKGCFGAQYEFGDEPFMPIESVCNLFKRKIPFILNKYKELGVLDYMRNFANSNLHLFYLNHTLDIIDDILNRSQEVHD